MTYTRGRPTVYRGIKMRSRLEASFAAWLDGCDGLTWEYEPQCFADASGQYLPDFLVHGTGGGRAYSEVKPPTADTTGALARMHIIRSSEPDANLWVVIPTGSYPNQKWTVALSCGLTNGDCHICKGVEGHDLRTIPGADRRVPAGYPKCSQEETAAFLADKPWP